MASPQGLKEEPVPSKGIPDLFPIVLLPPGRWSETLAVLAE
jgi:hypothetical protein